MSEIKSIFGNHQKRILPERRSMMRIPVFEWTTRTFSTSPRVSTWTEFWINWWCWWMLCFRKERNWRGRYERKGLSIHQITAIIQTQIISSWRILISLIGLNSNFRVSVGRKCMWEIMYNTLTKIWCILNLVIKIKLIENITR